LSANWQHEGQTKRKPSNKTLQLDIVIPFSGLALGMDNASANGSIRTSQNGPFTAVTQKLIVITVYDKMENHF